LQTKLDEPVRLEAMSEKKRTSSPPKIKKMLLVDDHPLMRRGQADLLSREQDLMVQ